MTATGYTKPVLDEIQNYELTSGQKVDGRTTIKFRRKWRVCNKFAENIGVRFLRMRKIDSN